MGNGPKPIGLKGALNCDEMAAAVLSACPSPVAACVTRCRKVAARATVASFDATGTADDDDGDDAEEEEEVEAEANADAETDVVTPAKCDASNWRGSDAATSLTTVSS